MDIIIGCKFCEEKFSVHQLLEYINHLERHCDKKQDELSEIEDELRRVRNIPK